MKRLDPEEEWRRECVIALLILLTVGVLLLIAQPVRAAPDERTTPLPTEAPKTALRCVGAHELAEGAIAPCGGLLVPEEQAREAVLCVGVGLPSCRVELLECRDVAAAERRACVAAQSADALEIAALRHAVTTIREPRRAWYEHPAAVAAMASVGGIALGVAIGWAVSK